MINAKTAIKHIERWIKNYTNNEDTNPNDISYNAGKVSAFEQCIALLEEIEKGTH